jgi:hypothetical protein
VAHEVTPGQLKIFFKHLSPLSAPFFKNLFEFIFGYNIDDLHLQSEDKQCEQLTNCE